MQIFPSSSQAKKKVQIDNKIQLKHPGGFVVVKMVDEYDVGGINKLKQYIYCITLHFAS